MNNDISIIFNGYKRLKNLNEQWNCIIKQTIKPKNIFIWVNDANVDQSIHKNIESHATIARCNKNLGVWSRFYFALNCSTEYICVIDDDTFPGDMWLENCITHINKQDGLYGSRGVIFRDKSNYRDHYDVGWTAPNESVTQVDLVGHNWFFRKEHLTAYLREFPKNNYTIAGEDMHFSYTLQKFMNLGTYVPPHPVNNTRLWGSDYKKGWELGTDSAAISHTSTGLNQMQKYFDELVTKGYKFLEA